MDYDIEYCDREEQELEEDCDVVDGIMYVKDFDSVGRDKICE